MTYSMTSPDPTRSPISPIPPSRWTSEAGPASSPSRAQIVLTIDAQYYWHRGFDTLTLHLCFDSEPIVHVSTRRSLSLSLAC